MKVKFISHATVMQVEERVARRHVRGAGKDAVFQENSDGWYAKFAEWPASAYLGKEDPGLKVGDRIKITVEKI